MDDIKIRLALDGANEVNAGAKKAAEGLGALGAAGQKAAQQGKLTSYQLQEVSVQLQDLFIQIQGGQAPLTALLQQGSQLTTVFGSAGNALKAVGGFAATLITPLTLAATAVGVLGYGFLTGSAQSETLRKSVILTGAAAGASADQLQLMANRLSAVGSSQAQAVEALSQFVETTNVGVERLERFTKATLDFQRVGGGAVADVVKNFAELGKDPVEAIKKLDERTHFLTASVFEQIKALKDQGRETEAAAKAQEAYAAFLEDRTPKLAANLGLLARLWRDIKEATGNAVSAVQGIGRDDTLAEQIKKVEVDLSVARSRAKVPAGGGYLDMFFAGRAEREAQELEKVLDKLRESQRIGEQVAAAAAKRNDLEQARIKWLQEGDKYLSKEQQAQREIAAIRQQGAEAGAKQAEIETRIAAVRAKYANTSGDNELADLRAKLKETNNYIDALSKQGTIVRELNDGERAALRIQEQLKETLSSTVRAEKEKALALATQLGQRQRLATSLKEDIDQGARFVDSVSQQADAIREKAAQQEAANATLGVSRTAIEAMTLAEAKRQAQDLEATDNVNPKYLAGLNAKIEAQERFVKALRDADFKQLNQGLDEWVRSAGEQKRLFEDEQRLVGLTRLERDKVVAARQVELKLAKELAKINQSDLTEAQKDMLRIKAREAAEAESSAAVAKVVRDDWSRTADYIEQSLVDSLMRGGKSGADYLKDIFRTLVLRPTLQAAVQPFAGATTSAINSLLGTGGTTAGAGAGGAGGGLGGLGSLFGLGGAGSLGGAFSSAFSGGTALGGDAIGAGFTALFNGSGTLAGNFGQILGGANGALSSIGGLGGALGYGTALVNLSQGKYGSAAGTAIGTFVGGPIGAAIGGAIGGAIDKAFGSVGAKQSGASYLSNGTTGQAVNGGMFGLDRAWGDSIGKYFSQGVQDALKTSTTVGAGLLNSVSTAFGGIGGYQVGAFFASDNTRASQGNRSVLGPNGQVLSSWSGSGLDKDPTKGLQQLTNALAGDVRTALQQIDIPGWAKSQLQMLTGDVTFEQLSNVVQSIIATKEAFKSLGEAMPQLTNLTDAAVEGLLKAFGGLDNLKGAASSYYDNFYTQAEKNAAATRQLGDAIGALGLQVPTTRDAYRSLVEAQDLNTEAGRAAYAQLLKLSPAFAALVPAAQDLASSASAAAEQMIQAGRRALAELASENGSLQVELLKAQGDTVAAAALARQQALAKLTDGLSAQDAAAATAAYDLNAALRQQVDALNAAATAAQQAAQAEAQRAAAVAAQADSIQARIDDLLGDVAAQRARELAGLDESNRALQQRYYDLLDAKTAQEAANQAAQDAARLAEQQAQAADQAAREAARVAEQQAEAARQLRDAWKSVGDTLLEESQRLLGMSTTDAALSRAQAESRFAIVTAQARAGDQDAAKQLPTLSRALEQIIAGSATSRSELELARAQIAASLRDTVGVLGGLFGFSPASSAPSVDVSALLGQVASTAPITSQAAAQQQATAAQQSNIAALVDEVRALRAEVQALKDPATRTAAAAERSRDVLVQVTDNGTAMQVEQA